MQNINGDSFLNLFVFSFILTLGLGACDSQTNAGADNKSPGSKETRDAETDDTSDTDRTVETETVGRDTVDKASETDTSSRECIEPPPEACYTSGSKVCSPACESSDDCSETEVCRNNGLCGPRPCQADADCANVDLICTEEGTCARKSCATDSDCAESSYCVKQRCYQSLGECSPLPM